MRLISSINNDYIKELAKLKLKKYRDEKKMFLIEGYHLIEMAKKYLLTVLVIDEKDINEDLPCEFIKVTKDIIVKLTSVNNPQPIIGVCRFLDERSDFDFSRVLMLDNIQDPGNIGTLIRSALAFNIDLVVFGDNSVDIYNDKIIRGTQGAIFEMKIIHANIKEYIEILKENDFWIYGTSLKNGIDLKKVIKKKKYALILGNEGNGIDEDILRKTDENIFVEMSNRIESLNVGVAGSIIMYYMFK